MQVYGNIATEPTSHADRNGKPYFRFRLAENQGEGNYRTTTWYSVTAFIKEQEAQLLSNRAFVVITGTLRAQLFQRKPRDGEQPGPGGTVTDVDLQLTTGSVQLVPRKENREGGAARAPRQAQSSAPAPAPASSGFGPDLDDDIPF